MSAIHEQHSQLVNLQRIVTSQGDLIAAMYTQIARLETRIEEMIRDKPTETDGRRADRRY